MGVDPCHCFCVWFCPPLTRRRLGDWESHNCFPSRTDVWHSVCCVWCLRRYSSPLVLRLLFHGTRYGWFHIWSRLGSVRESNRKHDPGGRSGRARRLPYLVGPENIELANR